MRKLFIFLIILTLISPLSLAYENNNIDNNFAINVKDSSTNLNPFTITFTDARDNFQPSETMKIYLSTEIPCDVEIKKMDYRLVDAVSGVVFSQGTHTFQIRLSCFESFIIIDGVAPEVPGTYRFEYVAYDDLLDEPERSQKAVIESKVFTVTTNPEPEICAVNTCTDWIYQQLVDNGQQHKRDCSSFQHGVDGITCEETVLTETRIVCDEGFELDNENCVSIQEEPGENQPPVGGSDDQGSGDGNPSFNMVTLFVILIVLLGIGGFLK